MLNRALVGATSCGLPTGITFSIKKTRPRILLLVAGRTPIERIKLGFGEVDLGRHQSTEAISGIIDTAKHVDLFAARFQQISFMVHETGKASIIIEAALCRIGMER